MNTLSKQVSRLSQELQEMTFLLKPLLLQTPPPILMTMVPNPTLPPSSTGHLSTSTSLLAPPPATPCPPQRPDSHSLLDGGDMEGVVLPGCLLPTPHAPSRPPPSASPCRTSGAVNSDLLGREDGAPEGSAAAPRSLHASPSNGVFLPTLQDPPPHTPSPSLSFSMSLSSSPSLSPCQGPHPPRPASCSGRGLLPPPPSQDTPPPLSSHCSAPPSLTSSPGDRQLRPSPSVPPVSPAVPLHPSTFSLPLSLDFARGRRPDAQTHGWCKPLPLRHGGGGGGDARPRPPQELEMQEWGRREEEEEEGEGEEGEGGRSLSGEHISFIDEEEPAL